MRLIDALPLTRRSRVAFVGAGGKSSAMFRLGAEWVAENGCCIILTATTHLAVEQLASADQAFEVETIEDVGRLFETMALEGSILLHGPIREDGRTKGLSERLAAEIHQLSVVNDLPMLIEADGSRRRPLKAPAGHEPALPMFAETVVVVAGMLGVNQPLSEQTVHRPALFGELAGIQIGDRVTTENISDVLLSAAGGLKGIPPQARRMALLNQCDTDERAGMAKRLAERLLEGYERVIFGNLVSVGEREVLSVHRQMAGVVLAAGGSSRMGRLKQLLDWRGQPFVRVVAEMGIIAGLLPVIVVVGAEHERVSEALAGLDVHIVHNPAWEEGQSTSVREALRVIPNGVGGAVFLLADQPHIPAPLVRALVERASQTMAPITAPLVDGRRGNPVVFDRRTFADLAGVAGDAGGRQVFSRYQVDYLPWLDWRVSLDVDTQEDYERLLGLDEEE